MEDQIYYATKDEMRRYSNENIISQYKDEIDEIFAKIYEAANNCRKEVCIYHEIRFCIERLLIDFGYRIEYDCAPVQLNGNNVTTTVATISWY